VVVVVVDAVVGGVVVVEVVGGRAPVPVTGVVVVGAGVDCGGADWPVPMPSPGSAAGADAPVGDATPDPAGVSPPAALLDPVWLMTGRDGATT
jgi:hypothetical protein